MAPRILLNGRRFSSFPDDDDTDDSSGSGIPNGTPNGIIGLIIVASILTLLGGVILSVAAHRHKEKTNREAFLRRVEAQRWSLNRPPSPPTITVTRTESRRNDGHRYEALGANGTSDSGVVEEDGSPKSLPNVPPPAYSPRASSEERVIA